MYSLATFETNLTTVVITLFELNNKEQAKERKEYEDRRNIDKQQRFEAEAKREEYRKVDNIIWEQWHRDDVQKMEKLEERWEEKRAADQLNNQQLMINMMQHLYQPLNTHQQQQNLSVPAILPFPPVTRTNSNQLCTTPTGTSHSESAADDLATSMDKANLESADPAKKQKTTDHMHLEDNHSPLPPPTGGQQYGHLTVPRNAH